MDRIETALNTAGRLLDRLMGTQPEKRTTFSPKLMGQLAQQLYLISEAYNTFEEKLPKDAFLKVDANFRMQKEIAVGIDFFERIVRMYRSWALKRRMRTMVLRDTRDESKKEYQFMLAVSGFGSYSILQGEQGLHVLEVPTTQKASQKYNIQVRICPQPEIPAQNKETLLEQADQEFLSQTDSGARIVRHYRIEPSPLIRDNIRKWRSGRLDRVLEGDFDLMG
jgi:ATP-dependent Clp protease ATP-binding subunit ClpC